MPLKSFTFAGQFTNFLRIEIHHESNVKIVENLNDFEE